MTYEDEAVVTSSTLRAYGYSLYDYEMKYPTSLFPDAKLKDDERDGNWGVEIRVGEAVIAHWVTDRYYDGYRYGDSNQKEVLDQILAEYIAQFFTISEQR